MQLLVSLSSSDVFSDPVAIAPAEKSEVKVPFSKPGQGTYTDIRWFKETRTNRIAFYKEGLNNDQVLYQGDFCPGGGTCSGTSPKGELDTTTGELTINSAELSDEDVYFYDFFISNDDDANVNTGPSYQINLFIFGKCVCVMYLTQSQEPVFFFIPQQFVFGTGISFCI